MLSAIATVKPGQKKKRPKPHDEPKIEYSKFVPLPPEENPPEAAPVTDFTYDAEELEQPEEEIDEWQAAMQAAEEDFESETTKTDVGTDVGMSLEEERFEASDDEDEPFFPEMPVAPIFKRAPKQVKTYHGVPLGYDDEYVP